MILPKERDPRFITVRRGGTLSDPDHHLLAIWAADCAQHVLHHFEQARPGDDRPRQAIELARAWARGEIPMKQAHQMAFAANAAARDLSGAARMAALAAGQAVAVAHVAAHELGAAAYAIYTQAHDLIMDCPSLHERAHRKLQRVSARHGHRGEIIIDKLLVWLAPLGVFEAIALAQRSSVSFAAACRRRLAAH